MEVKSLTIQYEEYNGREALSKSDGELFDAAVEALKSSYAPYSNFNVGAAVRLDNGVIVKGSNQENAAYPSGLCAERTALFAAGAQYPDQRVVALAVVCAQNGKLLRAPGYPCGACRQVMAQSERRAGEPMRIIMGGSEKVQIVSGVSSILPFVFNDL